MVFIGICGSETPVGQILTKMVSKSEQYKIAFLQDENSPAVIRKLNIYRSLDDALILAPPTLVIDVTGSHNAYDRLKMYRDFDVPAIVVNSGISDEQKDTMRRIRAQSLNSPSLLLERTPDFYLEMILQQLDGLFKLEAENVDHVNIFVQAKGQPNLVAGDFLWLLHHINSALGVNEQAFPTLNITKNGSCIWKAGLVKLEITELAQGMIDESVCIQAALKNADDLADKNALTHVISYEFAGRREDSIRRGFEKLLNYITVTSRVAEGRIESNMLPMLIRQCW